MPKAVYVPPPLSVVDIPPEGANVLIDEVRIVENQWTTIGTCKLGLGITVIFRDAKYSQLFSLDKQTLTGSIGRILVSIGIDNTDIQDFQDKIQQLKGKTMKVFKKAGKLYWYP